MTTALICIDFINEIVDEPGNWPGKGTTPTRKDTGRWKSWPSGKPKSEVPEAA